MVQTARSVFTGVGAGVAIVGTGRGSRLSLGCDDANGHRELFRVEGSGVIFENIALVRATACSGVMVALHPPLGSFTMKNVVLDGGSGLGGDMSGLVQPNLSRGAYGDIRLVGTTVRNFSSYGYFQPNEAVTSTDGVIVDGCTFANNGADDLEFNAPAGVMRNITVKNSSFSGNRSRTTSAGFGVGLANVQNVVISGNSFDRYNYEPIHVEDRSSNVTIERNTFTHSSVVATGYSSHIFIVSGSRSVTIKENRFDTTGNTNKLWVVWMGPGGPTSRYPSDVTITGNTFTLSRSSSATYDGGIPRLAISANTIKKSS